LGADDGEEGYVCECCDPGKKKKGSESSEDNSEIEQDESLEPEVRNLRNYLIWSFPPLVPRSRNIFPKPHFLLRLLLQVDKSV
jgi:hypothetical protein